MSAAEELTLPAVLAAASSFWAPVLERRELVDSPSFGPWAASAARVALAASSAVREGCIRLSELRACVRHAHEFETLVVAATRFAGGTAREARSSADALAQALRAQADAQHA